MIQKCTCVPESAVNAIPPYGGSNPPAPAPHSRSPETVPAGGKVPVFPGVCAPKSNTEIGDPAKKAGLARFGGPVSKGRFSNLRILAAAETNFLRSTGFGLLDVEERLCLPKTELNFLLF